MDEQERRDKRLEAYGLQELEESGLEKMEDLSVAVDEELVLVGAKGPVPYKDLLTEEEYRFFRELAVKKDPSEEEVRRGQALLVIMMDRYPDGPGAK